MIRSELVRVEPLDDEIVARVAAIDVGKDSGMVCTRVPHPEQSGKRRTTVWSVPARTGAITELADRLRAEGIERVVLEATSDYWRPFFYLLEARGIAVWLANAREVKNVPGRPKTDKLDAVWLAKLNERGMLRPSFVPPPEIRQLRDYTRLRADLTAERSRHIQRLEKLLEDALIKLSCVATNMMGVSGRNRDGGAWELTFRNSSAVGLPAPPSLAGTWSAQRYSAEASASLLRASMSRAPARGGRAPNDAGDALHGAEHPPGQQKE